MGTRSREGDRSSDHREMQSEFLLEFPWNFYGFRDILTENSLVFLWTYCSQSQDSLGRRCKPALTILEGQEGKKKWKLRNKKLKRLQSWPDWS